MEVQKTRSGGSCEIPLDIAEEIMLNLPVKSLVRFSSASKSWNSLIFDAGFIRKHKNRAARLNRHRIVINPDYVDTTSFCAIASISSDKPMGIVIKPPANGNAGDRALCSISSMNRNEPNVDATEFVSQLQGKPCLYAFCDELWCVEVQNSLFLWNPTIRICKKLPDPLFHWQNAVGVDWQRFDDEYFGQFRGDENVGGPGLYDRYEYVYGLGYDFVAAGYKILKVPRVTSSCTDTEMYSLRRNCWRKIESFSAKPSFLQERCEFVDGTFHWVCLDTTPKPIVFSFNLSREEYAEVAQPDYSPVINFLDEDGMEVLVVRDKLCMCVNYSRDTRFVLWVMEEYGVERSWTIKFDIQYGSSLPYFPTKASADSLFTLKPLYFYDNGDIMIKLSTDDCNLEIFMYKSDVAIPIRVVSCGNCENTSDAFLYVESLVSPVVGSDD